MNPLLTPEALEAMTKASEVAGQNTDRAWVAFLFFVLLAFGGAVIWFLVRALENFNKRLAELQKQTNETTGQLILTLDHSTRAIETNNALLLQMNQLGLLPGIPIPRVTPSPR